MRFIILVLALCLLSVIAVAQFVQPMLMSGQRPAQTSIPAGVTITSVTPASGSFNPGTTNSIVQMSATLSNGGVFSGGWNMITTGTATNPSGAACPNNSAAFTVTATGLLSSTTASLNQSYSVCIGASQSGLSPNPYVQLVSLTPSASLCSANGTAGSQGMTYANGTGTATLYWGDCRQVLDGWGVDSGPPPYLTSGELDALYTLTGGPSGIPGSGAGLGLNVHRVWINYYTAQNAGDQGAVTQSCSDASGAVSRGANLVFSSDSNTNPALIYYMQTDGVGGKIQNYANYAQFLTNFYNSMQSVCGVHLNGVSIQNEPDISQAWQLYEDTGSQMRDFIKTNLAPTFASNGVTAQIMLPEQASWAFDLAGPTFADSTALSKVGIIDVHNYAQPTGMFPYPQQSLGLHGWATEQCCAFQWGQELPIATNIIQSLIDGNVNMWSYEFGTNLFDNSNVACCFFIPYANFTRFIRQGWHIYGATEHPDSGQNVWLMFARNPTTQDFTVVAVNNNTSSTPLTFVFNGFTAPSVTPYVSNGSPINTGGQSGGSLMVAQQGSVTAGSGFSYTLAAQSVTTFTGTANTASAIQCDVGPPYVGTIPSGASSVGFTHCAVNYDFTQTGTFTNSNVPGTSGGGGSYQWSNLASWLSNCGAAAPLANGYAGIGCNPPYSVINDGGVQVFDVIAAASQVSDWGSGPGAGNGVGGNDQVGFKIPQNFYMDMIWKQINQTSGAGGNYDIWLYTQPSLGDQGPYTFSAQEVDFTETSCASDTTSCGIYSAGCHEWSGNYCGVSGTFNSVIVGNYNRYGWRQMVAADGSLIDSCVYVNGSPAASPGPCGGGSGYACNTFNSPDSRCSGVQAPTQNNRLWIVNWVRGLSTSGVEIRFQRYTIWTACANWVDLSHPDVGNDYGTGAHQCGWSTPNNTP